jgi:voltage-gated potassium channel
VPAFLYRLGQVLRARLTGWRLPLAIAMFVFWTSWLLMVLVEPASNEITRPANYWWYFLVTAATVGYGDFFPISPGGHLVGVYVIVGGIVTLTLLFTQLATYLQTVKGRRMRGQQHHDARDHVVILGYTPGRTERIVAELGAEDRIDVVLCAWDDVTEHPMPEHPGVRFVRGDLTGVDVMARAGVAHAATVVIDARDDNETLAVLVAAYHANAHVHLVASLRDMTRSEHLHYVDPDVQCVQWHMPNLLVEEVQDPGITQVYADLMTSGGHGNTYSARLPRARTFGECQTLFGQRHGATAIAVRRPDGLLVSPPWDTELAAGSTVYYLAAERIEDPELVAG